MERIRLSVEGMSCEHCVVAVRQALTDVEGTTVEEVQVGSATVSIDLGVTSVGALIDAVTDAGYEANEAR